MKHVLKLALIVTVVVVSVFALKYTFENGVEFERTDGQTVRTDSTDNISQLGVVATDFKKFVNTISDLIGYTQGKEAEGSGLDQLRKKPDEDNASSEKKIDLWNEESPVLEKAELLYVVDGDTIIIKNKGGNEEKIRFIGIDTPESVNQDEEKNNEYGIMASDHTKELLNGVKTVYLEYDTDKKDDYDRTLAYVWLNEDTSDVTNMLNARIMADGYAKVMSIEPNTKYEDVFKSLKNGAEENSKGLWKYEGYKEIARD